MMLLTFVRVNAGAFESDGFTFEIQDDGSVSITDCTLDSIENFTIPASVTYAGQTYNVSRIGEMAFARKNYKTVVVPEGIERIEYCAFLLNGVSYVRLPQTLTFLAGGAFQRCDLKSINIPPNIEQESTAFFDYAGGEDETINNVVIESADTEFKHSLDCRVDTLTVRRPWSGTCHGVNHKLTFDGSGLADYVIDLYCMRRFDVLPEVIEFTGDNITLINSEYSYNGSLTEISYFDTSIIDWVCYSYNKPDFEKVDAMETMTAQVHTVNINCNKFKAGRRTFSHFEGMTSFAVNAGEIDVKRSTFANCSELSYVNMSPFKGLEDGMFQNCVKLSELIIAPACSYINGSAFMGCATLNKIEIAEGDSPFVIGAGAFKKIPLEDLTIRRNFVSFDAPFYNIATLSRLTLGEDVTELPDYAFAGCTGLREIYCDASTPPVIHPNTFKGVSRTECKVFVRDNEDGYKEADGWDEFFSSLEDVAYERDGISVTSSGRDLIVSGAAADRIVIYDFSGSEIDSQPYVSGRVSFTLPQGHYIIVAGNCAVKYFHNY